MRRGKQVAKILQRELRITRNPYAKALERTAYRQRVVADKRRRALDKAAKQEVE